MSRFYGSLCMFEMQLVSTQSGSVRDAEECVFTGHKEIRQSEEEVASKRAWISVERRLSLRQHALTDATLTDQQAATTHQQSDQK